VKLRMDGDPADAAAAFEVRAALPQPCTRSPAAVSHTQLAVRQLMAHTVLRSTLRRWKWW